MVSPSKSLKCHASVWRQSCIVTKRRNLSMRISRYLLSIGILGAAWLLPAQVSHMRASLSGTPGVAAEEGRCTFQVEVDGAAQLEIHGDQADLTTTSGQQARWRRLECTSMMPSHPANFQFRG